MFNILSLSLRNNKEIKSFFSSEILLSFSFSFKSGLVNSIKSISDNSIKLLLVNFKSNINF